MWLFASFAKERRPDTSAQTVEEELDFFALREKDGFANRAQKEKS